MTRLPLLALALAGANASIFTKRQTSAFSDDSSDILDEACRPSTDRGYDFNAPCNAVMSIQYECMYGPIGGQIIRAAPNDTEAQYGDDEDGPSVQPFEAQRICFCQSQFEDMVTGCMQCLEAHGGAEGEDWFDMSGIHPVVEKYCDANTPATEGFDTFFYNAVEKNMSADASSSTSAFSDPIGTATDVSLYSFTPSVTGSAAYVAGMPTPEVSGGNVTYTSSKTSNGQIVPTAVGNEREEDSSSTQATGSAQSGEATAPSSDSGAMQTAMAHSGAFGALGFAAIIAAL